MNRMTQPGSEVQLFLREIQEYAPDLAGRRPPAHAVRARAAARGDMLRKVTE